MSDSLWGDALPPEMPIVAAERQLTPKQILHRAKNAVNPCILVYGPGPEGATCKGCKLLHSGDYHNKIYHKCELRGFTHGPGTDHRVRWAACAKFVARGNE